MIGGVTGHLSKGMSRSQANGLGGLHRPRPGRACRGRRERGRGAIQNAVTRAEKQTAQELNVDPKDIDKALQEAVKEM